MGLCFTKKNKKYKKRRIYKKRIHGGEMIGTITLDDLYEQDRDLPIDNYTVDEVRTNQIDFDNMIGKGFEGTVRPLIHDNTKVVKLFKLKPPFTVPGYIKESIILSYYASNIGIGPQIYGPPFITTDGKHVAFIMDKVEIYDPSTHDDDEIIQLYERSINNNFFTYDFKFAKTLGEPSRIVLVDFGISGIYRSPQETLESAISEGIFQQIKGKFYSKNIEDHFNNLNEIYKGRKGGKRMSKMKCQRATRKNSKLPPFKANTCPNKIKKGKDGMYISKDSSNGIWVWKKSNNY